MLLGLDVGTSGCKAVLFDEEGRAVAGASRSYPLICRYPGWMELDTDKVLSSCFAVLAECTEGRPVEAIAVSSQGEAVIPVGRDGQPLYNAIVTFDTRNTAEHEWLLEHTDIARRTAQTGRPVHPMFSLPKLLWLKRNVPRFGERIWKVMCFGDYVAFRLGAPPVMDDSLASRTMAFDIRKKAWIWELIEQCGLPYASFPEVSSCGALVGQVAPDTACLPRGTKIVTGAHDQACCALGVGVVKSDVAMDSLGTTESILCVSDAAVASEPIRENNFPCDAYALDGMYAYLGFLSCSGLALRWFKDDVLQFAGAYEQLECGTCPQPTGLYFVPHLAGSGSPWLDFEARGVFAGLTAATGRVQMYQAIMEGVAFESRLNMERMVQCGLNLNEIRCIGGGTRSERWMQIKANITGRSLYTVDVQEAGCLGAALLAGLGAGVYHGVDDISVAQPVRVYEPILDISEQYDVFYGKYKQLYQAIRSII